MNRLTAYIFCYCDPVRLQAVNTMDPRYQERKIIFSDKYKVIGLEHGYKVSYSIRVYKFNNISPDEQKIKRLWEYVVRNPEGQYEGWPHHMNLYFPTKPKKKFWGQRKY